ncbi:hypothetical protein DFH08DRAFT_802074 [Mycena albidolilacea]|uniref:Uncharacterized protein n=1 Tax=Mycena albidolilacea TaxID=1033008 RepID=A0AAD7AGK5_9AGAR|nr:hypothetical protein DFH08DRAFT_802074 [Mycena albidolilacea]
MGQAKSHLGSHALVATRSSYVPAYGRLEKNNLKLPPVAKEISGPTSTHVFSFGPALHRIRVGYTECARVKNSQPVPASNRGPNPRVDRVPVLNPRYRQVDEGLVSKLFETSHLTAVWHLPMPPAEHYMYPISKISSVALQSVRDLSRLPTSCTVIVANAERTKDLYLPRMIASGSSFSDEELGTILQNLTLTHAVSPETDRDILVTTLAPFLNRHPSLAELAHQSRAMDLSNQYNH